MSTIEAIRLLKSCGKFWVIELVSKLRKEPGNEKNTICIGRPENRQPFLLFPFCYDVPICLHLSASDEDSRFTLIRNAFRPWTPGKASISNISRSL